MSRLAIYVVAILVLFVSAAQAQDVESARAAFARGVTSYEAEDYETALGAFQEAYRAAPHPTVRVNIANCYEQLERPVPALENYERFLAEADSVSPAQRTAVEAAIERLRPQVGYIRFEVEPEGASILIDGYQRVQGPLREPVGVIAGYHSIEITMDGHQPRTLALEVGGTVTERVSVLLEPIPAAVPEMASIETPAVEVSETPAPDYETEVAPANAGSGGGFRITGEAWLFAAITVAAGIGAGVTGGLALWRNDLFDQAVSDYYNEDYELASRDTAGSEARQFASEASDLALATDILLAVTAAGAVATVVTLIVTQGSDDSNVDVRLGPGSLQLRRSF